MLHIQAKRGRNSEKETQDFGRHENPAYSTAFEEEIAHQNFALKKSDESMD